MKNFREAVLLFFASVRCPPQTSRNLLTFRPVPCVACLRLMRKLPFASTPPQKRDAFNVESYSSKVTPYFIKAAHVIMIIDVDDLYLHN